ncbi:MAG: hypothetical protein ACXADH_14135 [Candidatus Kariarchaeaceae archaeon]|jgi:hypothetical protein
MGIRDYYFKNLRAELIRDEYWDFYITGDDQGECLGYATQCSDSCSDNYDIIQDGLVVWFDTADSGSTTDGTSITSLVEWDGYEIKPSSGFTLCDFGLTGVDNGLYDQLSGITTVITSADTRVVLYPVTGYTIQEQTFTACTSAVTNIISGVTATTCVSYSSETRYVTTKGKYDYPWTFRTGSTTPEGCDVGPTICLNGGFYQGYFKLDFLEPQPVLQINTGETTACGTGATTTELVDGDPDGMKYQLMPTEFEEGWTMETWIKWDNSYCQFGCISGTTSGATSGATGTSATTICTTGHTLNMDYTGNTGFFFYIGTRAENKFRNVFSGETGLYTCDGLVPLAPNVPVETGGDGQSWFTRSNLGLPDCWCPTPCPTGSTTTSTGSTEYCDELSENALGFRITPDGRIGYRKMTVSMGCYNNKDRITGTTMEEGYSENPVFFTGDTWNHVAVTWTYNTIRNGLPAGTLRFWVNGRVVYRVENFIGLQLRALNEWSYKQLGVPFNMSWGGGTQGLLESQTFGGPDPADQGLDLETYFAGTFEGELSQLRFYEKPLNLIEIRNNFFVDCNRYCRPDSFGGSVMVIPGYDGCDDCGRGNYRPWDCP